MPLDLSLATDLRIVPQAGELRLSWTSGAPAGATFQVYGNAVLMWYGPQTACIVPYPSVPTTWMVGAVGSGEGPVNFASSLPAPTGGGNRPALSWHGGTYEDPDDVDAFRIYRSATAGGAVDYTAPVATVPAYPGGVLTDGYGEGGYGRGGYGRSASDYTWTGPALAPGSWMFAVVPVDLAGNEGTARTWTFSIAGPPPPPAPDAAGGRLSYTYDPATRIVTLDWLAPA